MCQKRFPRHWLQRKPLVSDPGIHHGTCVTLVPWCMSGSLTGGSGEKVPGIPGACSICNFRYLVRAPCKVYCLPVEEYLFRVWHQPFIFNDKLRCISFPRDCCFLASLSKRECIDKWWHPYFYVEWQLKQTTVEGRHGWSIFKAFLWM